MGVCITCKWYSGKETADGMVRKCKLDGQSVYPTSKCNSYEPHDKKDKNR